jgi:hypothetical protein
MYTAETTYNIVSKVITRNATSGCSVLAHNTKFFVILRNYGEIQVNVSMKLNEWIINEHDNIYTT